MFPVISLLVVAVSASMVRWSASFPRRRRPQRWRPPGPAPPSPRGPWSHVLGLSLPLCPTLCPPVCLEAPTPPLCSGSDLSPPALYRWRGRAASPATLKYLSTSLVSLSLWRGAWDLKWPKDVFDFGSPGRVSGPGREAGLRHRSGVIQRHPSRKGPGWAERNLYGST